MPVDVSAVARQGGLTGMHIASVYGVEKRFIRRICSVHEQENFIVRAHCAASSRKSQRKFFHFTIQSFSWKVVYS